MRKICLEGEGRLPELDEMQMDELKKEFIEMRITQLALCDDKPVLTLGMDMDREDILIWFTDKAIEKGFIPATASKVYSGYRSFKAENWYCSYVRIMTRKNDLTALEKVELWDKLVDENVEGMMIFLPNITDEEYIWRDD